MQTGAQHYALSIGERRVAVGIAFCLEFQRQGADLLAPVEYQRLDQPGAHGGLEIEVHHDVREIGLALVFPHSDIVVGRCRKIDLHEAAPLFLGDSRQAFLPLDFAGLALFLHFVDVMRLVVEYHQRRQRGQVVEHAAARVAPIQHLQTVAGRLARRQWQHVGDHPLRIGQRTRCLDFRFGLILAFHQCMPVGDGDQSVARGLEADFILDAEIAAHEAEYQFPVALGNEQLFVFLYVRCGEVSSAVTHLAEQRVEQPLIDDQARRHDQEVAREARIVDSLRLRRRLVEQRPDQQRLHHPGLAGAGRHFQAVLRVAVFGLRHFGQSTAGQ